MPGNFFHILNYIYYKYTAMQREFKYYFYSKIVGAIVVSVVSYIMVFKFGLTTDGIGIANSVHNIVRFIIIYFLCHSDKRFGCYIKSIFSKDSITHLRSQA